MRINAAHGCFKSAPTGAGIIYVLIGFIPDYFEFLSGIDQTNPSLYRWFNKTTFPLYGAQHDPTSATNYDRTIIDTGSSGVMTVDVGSTPLITAYTGGDAITTSEVATNGVAAHVDRAGALVTVPTGGQVITQAGIKLVASIQTASAYNAWSAYRNDK